MARNANFALAGFSRPRLRAGPKSLEGPRQAARKGIAAVKRYALAARIVED